MVKKKTDIYWFLRDKFAGNKLAYSLAAVLIATGALLLLKPDWVDSILDRPPVEMRGAVAYAGPVQASVDSVTVLVKCENTSGSGVKLNRAGVPFVLTAAHVVDDYVEVTENGSHSWKQVDVVCAVIVDGQLRGQETYKADIVIFCPEEDLAVLYVYRYSPWAESVRFGPATPVAPGTRLLHVGNFRGLMGQASYSEGVLSHLGRVLEGKLYDQTTVIAYPGSSGGGVFTTDGLYVGMVVRAAGSDWNLIIPIRRIERWARAARVPWVLDERCAVDPLFTRPRDIGPTLFN